jgi:hypothetical protein
MSDNIGYTPGSGATVAADNVGGALHQRVKLTFGGDGAASDVSEANPLPVLADFSVPENLLRQLVAAAASPAGFDRSLSRARVTAVLESGTVTTVTTVATVSSLTQLGSLPAQQLAVHQNLSAWHACVRSRIT